MPCCVVMLFCVVMPICLQLFVHIHCFSWKLPKVMCIRIIVSAVRMQQVIAKDMTAETLTVSFFDGKVYVM